MPEVVLNTEPVVETPKEIPEDQDCVSISEDQATDYKPFPDDDMVPPPGTSPFEEDSGIVTGPPVKKYCNWVETKEVYTGMLLKVSSDQMVFSRC